MSRAGGANEDADVRAKQVPTLVQIRRLVVPLSSDEGTSDTGLTENQPVVINVEDCFSLFCCCLVCCYYVFLSN